MFVHVNSIYMKSYYVFFDFGTISKGSVIILVIGIYFVYLFVTDKFHGAPPSAWISIIYKPYRDYPFRSDRIYDKKKKISSAAEPRRYGDLINQFFINYENLRK